MQTTIAGVVLAAGRGKRMGLSDVNKVSLPLGEKPLVLYAVELLKQVGASPIVVVVGFAKESVIRALGGHHVVFANQKRQLGTAHALSSAFGEIPSKISDVLVIQGDDVTFYKKETIQKLLLLHERKKAAITFLTLTIHKPFGLGRVIRDKKGKLLSIVEEKDATSQQRAIQEVNPACYVFSMRFLQKYIKRVKKSPITGEYYLTTLIDIAIGEKELVETFYEPYMEWRGVNTVEELNEAERMIGMKL